MAIRMPRFLTVVHQDVSNKAWCRPPELLSSTPSDTMNSTSCGGFPAMPVPGAGMTPLTPDMAASKSVSSSLLLLVEVNQLFLYTVSTSMPAASDLAVDRLEVSAEMVLIPPVLNV